MPYLSPHYDWDAFVSYAHAHLDGKPESPLKHWSNELIVTLQDDLRSLRSDLRDVTIWSDRLLDPTAKLTEDLRQKVKRSGILLVLMSGYYLDSDWCVKDEFKWFEEEVRLRREDLPRVFVVRVTPTAESDWPSFLRDERGYGVPGFMFHPQPVTEDDVVAPFGYPHPTYRHEEFWQALASLRTALARRLRDLKRREDARSQPPPAPAAAGAPPRPPRLYLHGLTARHQAIRDALSATGCVVVDPVALGGLDTWTRESRKRIEIAARCDALALVREPGDDRFPIELLEVGVEDRERIAAARGGAMPCAVLDAAGENPPPILDAYGIERFDLRTHEWPEVFRAWIDGWLSSPPPAGAPA